MHETIQKYFTAFSNKDIETLTTLYQDNVVLWEWGERVFMGKKDVLAANENLFTSSEQLAVLIQGYAEASDKYYVELSIMLDEGLISVLDVITLKDDKIVSVQAYRGF